MRTLLLLVGLLLPMAAHADFLDDDIRQAQQLGVRRHRLEQRLVENWLRALRWDEREIARHLAALTDDDLHRLVEAPETLWAAKR